jgi:hypothetical protein
LGKVEVVVAHQVKSSVRSPTPGGSPGPTVVATATPSVVEVDEPIGSVVVGAVDDVEPIGRVVVGATLEEVVVGSRLVVVGMAVTVKIPRVTSRPHVSGPPVGTTQAITLVCPGGAADGTNTWIEKYPFRSATTSASSFTA